MKRTRAALVLPVALALASAGCSTLGLGHRNPQVTKRFYSGSITYTLDADAQRVLSKIEKLQGNTLTVRSRELDPRSDALILPLYRDSDLNRDHHITRDEAEVFYREYVQQFEDGLGEAVYQ